MRSNCVSVPLASEAISDITLANKELKYTDAFNCLGIPVTAKGINFRLICQARDDAAVKISAYFKSVGCSGSGSPLYSEEDSPLLCTLPYGLRTRIAVLAQRESNMLDMA